MDSEKPTPMAIADWKVGDVMSAPARTVPEDTGYKDVAATLADLRVSAVPVIDREGRAVGVVSEADLLPKEEQASGGHRMPRQARRRADAMTAAALMTSPALTVPASASLAEAASSMRAHEVKRLVVVDPDGAVIGVVSRMDLVKPYLRADEQIERDVRALMHDVLWLEGSGIHVHVGKGVVDVEGRVSRASEAAVFVDLAGRLAGVVAVRSSLTWDEDDLHPHFDPSRPMLPIDLWVRTR
jgi:CBS domain-containing protein